MPTRRRGRPVVFVVSAPGRKSRSFESRNAAENFMRSIRSRLPAGVQPKLHEWVQESLMPEEWTR